ncbi:AraC family transcriptional regulator [Aquabacterium humicola]|uniref:AraC family transcriptional regulator n=1 Tax=Aquabacterium humicola TaxID=3237377 RepID=UPI0025434234|nr:helix-turn-helix domain-containing protein [Rubrivivax pictus]
MIDPFSPALRGLAVGLVLALLLGSLRLPSRARLALWPLLACLAAYLVRGEPLAAGWPVAALLPLSVAALVFPVAFWWLVHNVFDDRADLPALVLPSTLLLLATGLLPPPVPADASLLAFAPHAAQKAIGAAFVMAALWQLWRGRAGDLVPPRRVLRGALLAYIGVHGLVVLGVELWLLGRAPLPWLDTLNVAVIAAAMAAALALMLGIRNEVAQALFGAGPPEPSDPRSEPLTERSEPLTERSEPLTERSEPLTERSEPLTERSEPLTERSEPLPDRSDAPPARREPARRAVDAEDGVVDRLQRLMVVDQLYHEPALAIGALAERCGLPEYRLRELIHRRLGFRNFPAFVNEYRLREVERRLADPACDRMPILTLALEAGFGSIGPFNRAFRERHAMSPTEYRGRRGSAAPAA